MYPRTPNKKVSIKDRKIAAVARILKGARTTSYPSGTSFTRAPPASRGYYGPWSRLGGGELKTIDTGTINDSLAPTAVCTLINGVAVGTDYNTRDGRRIRMKHLTLKFAVYNSGASSSNPDVCRIMIVLDRQANGTVATSAQMLQTNTVFSPMNLDNRDRFLVLKDIMIGTEGATFSGGYVATGNSKSYVRKVFVPLNRMTTYSGTAATIGSISTNALYLVYNAQNSNQTSITYNSRVRFYEQGA